MDHVFYDNDWKDLRSNNTNTNKTFEQEVTFLSATIAI